LFLSIVLAIALSLLAVGVHYESLRFASAAVARPSVPPRLRVALAVLMALIAHVTEAVVFALGWAVLLHFDPASLSEDMLGAGDVLYFSLTTYTSLGYGDIVPLGPARLLAGIEALVGLVLIAWTASFTYFEMRRYWPEDKGL
jgi:hypothetical protein